MATYVVTFLKAGGVLERFLFKAEDAPAFRKELRRIRLAFRKSHPGVA